MAEESEKSVRQRLREFAAMAHERELAIALRKLLLLFAQWQAKKINAFELNDHIHQYHQHAAQAIAKIYTGPVDPDMLVARALRLGLLSAAEVGEELATLLAPLTSFFEVNSPDAE